MVDSSNNKLQGADVLWVKYQSGQHHKHPYAIKIQEELAVSTDKLRKEMKIVEERLGLH